MIDKVLKALVIYWRHLKFKKRQKGDIGIRSEAANNNNFFFVCVCEVFLLQNT